MFLVVQKSDVCRDARVMDQALALHDACLRAVLHQHYGYEVRRL